MRHLILVLCLICLWTPAGAQGVTATPDLRRLRAVETVDVVAAMSERYPGTLELLAREFPADHAQLLASLREIGARRDSEEVLLLRAFGELTELRRRYAERLRFAPSVAHSDMLSHLAVFYNLVFEVEGPEVCGRFAQDGSGVLFERGLSLIYAKALDQQSRSFFEAVVAAIEAPESSEPVQPDDWGLVFEQMVAAGAPPAFVTTIGAGNPRDPNLCPALAAMMLTSSLLDTPEGARTRADFARNLVGY